MKDINYEKVIKTIIANPNSSLKEIAILTNVPIENIKLLIEQILKFYDFDELNEKGLLN